MFEMKEMVDKINLFSDSTSLNIRSKRGFILIDVENVSVLIFAGSNFALKRHFAFTLPMETESEIRKLFYFNVQSYAKDKITRQNITKKGK